jgi:hypothetical protein
MAWVLYLIALGVVALAQALIGAQRRIVFLLIFFVVVVEAAHVVVILSEGTLSVLASVLVLGVLLPWAAATAVFAWRPTSWRDGVTSLASAGAYLLALVVGLVVDMSALIPQ